MRGPATARPISRPSTVAAAQPATTRPTPRPSTASSSARAATTNALSVRRSTRRLTRTTTTRPRIPPRRSPQRPRAPALTVHVEAGGEECSTCHTATLKVAHASTSTTVVRSPVSSATRTPRSVRVRDRCRLGERPLHRLPRHRRGHDARRATTTAHTVDTARGCADSGASCHGSTTSLAELHTRASPVASPTCASCGNTGAMRRHADDTRPAAVTADSCGSGSVGGCHSDKTTTNHGGKHTLEPELRATTTTQRFTGCTNSGARLPRYEPTAPARDIGHVPPGRSGELPDLGLPHELRASHRTISRSYAPTATTPRTRARSTLSRRLPTTATWRPLRRDYAHGRSA